MKYDLEIIIPIFHEEGNIYETLEKILAKVKLNYRIIVVYDYSEDPTVKIIKDNFSIDKIFLLKNKYKGLNGAIKSAFEITNSRAALLYPADDHDNFDLIEKMYEKFNNGFEIVTASRFMEGGQYKGAPFVKKMLVKLTSFTLSQFTSLPTKDPTNGFRLFSNSIIKKFEIKSIIGFTFSIELLAKAYRFGYKITEIPEKWPIRRQGKSKFKYSSIFYYLPWYYYILFSNFKKNEKKD